MSSQWLGSFLQRVEHEVCARRTRTFELRLEVEPRKWNTMLHAKIFDGVSEDGKRRTFVAASVHSLTLVATNLHSLVLAATMVLAFWILNLPE